MLLLAGRNFAGHELWGLVTAVGADMAWRIKKNLADLCVHGHAHAGSECGTTPGGAPVRNVALPVLQRAYAVYGLGEPAPAGERSLVR